MSFRDKADMFVAYPSRPLAPLKPLRDWSKYDAPSSKRLPARSVCATEFREALVLRYLRQAS